MNMLSTPKMKTAPCVLVVILAITIWSARAEFSPVTTPATTTSCAPSEEEGCDLRQCPVEGMAPFLQTPAQSVVSYDACLSTLYGGIPMLDRRILNTTYFRTHENILNWPNWTVAFDTTLEATKILKEEWENARSFQSVTEISQYAEMYHFFMENYAKNIPQPPQGHIMVGGIGYDPQLIDDYRWNDDNIFGQLRLMGNNPVQLQRVVLTQAESNLPVQGGMMWHELSAMLNHNFSFDQAVQWAMNDSTTNITQAINRCELYVLHYPLLARVMGDATASGAYANKLMMAPIALFVATKNDSYPLKPVAIQLGHTDTAPVYSPRSSPFWWTVSKLYVNNADGLASQIVHHLVNSHFVAEAFAAATYRQLPATHPVHQLLKHHFEGLVQINTAGFELLVNKNGSVSRVAGFGHKGLVEYIGEAYQDWTYEKMDFEGDLKARGVDDVGNLPKYPFRDDGRLLFTAIQDCVHEYVELFYCTSDDIKSDSALQNFMFEIFTMHENKGFSSNITSIAELETLLTRIIYINSVHHAAVNYPIRELGSSVLEIPFAVFRKPGNFTAMEMDVTPGHMDALTAFLGDLEHAALQEETATQLASLRYSDLFAYGPVMEFADQKVVSLINKYRTKLMGPIQTQIETNNAWRAANNLLQYPYMQPKIMPNSIAI